MATDSAGSESFADRVAALMERLAAELGSAATVERDGDDWQVRPARAQASPLWVAGADAWTLTVGFGRTGSRMELGYVDDLHPHEQLQELEAVFRGVIAGGLIERRDEDGGSRWWLTLPDGSTTHGSANWLPWFSDRFGDWREERFAPYAEAPSDLGPRA